MSLPNPSDEWHELTLPCYPALPGFDRHVMISRWPFSVFQSPILAELADTESASSGEHTGRAFAYL